MKRTTGLNPEPGVRVLSAVLLEPGLWPKVSSLGLEHFSCPQLRDMFHQMQLLDAEKEAIDRVNLCERNRESYLYFDNLEKELIPAARPAEIDRYIDRLCQETGMYQAIHSLDGLHEKAANGGITAQDLIALAELGRQLQIFNKTAAAGAELLGFSSTAQLFAAQEKNIEWMCWPFAAIGLASIMDALPKVGKTVLILHGILASRLGSLFLNFPTRPMRVVYVSEQSKASLAMQARDVGFTGEEPIEELLWITREDWSRHIYRDFLVKLEKEILGSGNYNCLVVDTLHTVARMEDENDASEVNRLGNLTLDVATRNRLALILGRHDRKSGGEVGISGRSSIQLSGLVDVILHLVRIPGKDSQRKLELLSRIPGLPNEQVIDLTNGVYVNWGVPVAPAGDRAEQVVEWYAENPALTDKQIVAKFANLNPPTVITERTARRYLAQARADKP